MGRKPQWAKLIQDFDFSRKGSMNTITNTLSYIHEVNIFSFTEIKSSLYEQPRGKYLDDIYIGKF